MSGPSYLPSYLTSEQRDAILHTGSPLLIIAGPGSGKTEVITWHVANLVRAGLVAPNHLLVTTFTNKAALERSRCTRPRKHWPSTSPALR